MQTSIWNFGRNAPDTADDGTMCGLSGHTLFEKRTAHTKVRAALLASPVMVQALPDAERLFLRGFEVDPAVRRQGGRAHATGAKCVYATAHLLVTSSCMRACPQASATPIVCCLMEWQTAPGCGSQAVARRLLHACNVSPACHLPPFGDAGVWRQWGLGGPVPYEVP